MKRFCKAAEQARLVTVLALSILYGCSTPYQKQGFDFMILDAGYSETRIDQNTFLVAFKGNSQTSRQTVETYLLRRCAELTLQAGFDYFVVASSDTQAINQPTVGGIGPLFISPSRSSNTVNMFLPTYSYTYVDQQASARIKTFKGEKPAESVNAFAARDVLKFLAPAESNERVSSNSPTSNYSQTNTAAPSITPPTVLKDDFTKPPATVASLTSAPPVTASQAPEQKPITKTYASLTLYDGPKVKSGVTLDAQFMDDGSGSGEGLVNDIANRLLKGTFTTVKPGARDRPQPIILDRATLNKLQILSDRPWVIATFSNADTVLECVYGETRPLGQKKGECRDNNGNRYHVNLLP